jgi:tryptophan-rich sensory protein
MFFSMTMKWIRVVQFVICILIPQIAGLIGARFTAPQIPTWYATLRKPPFTPPSAIFGPVWILLFIFMGIALYLIWIQGLQAPWIKPALVVFGVQLVLNVLWSVFFFGLRSPILGLVDIIVLWILILFLVILFLRINTAAGVLLIPYLLWVSFATILNASILRLNP